MDEIRNVFCVGRNYRLHAQELGNEVPTSPFLFSKPTHAIVAADGQAIALPADEGEVHHEIELVVRMAGPYEDGMPLDSVISHIALGIDFTLRDVQTVLKQKGHPWLRAKGFRNSAVLTPFQPFPGLRACEQTDFKLVRNGTIVQQGNIRDMLFDIPTILNFTAHHFGLGEGDIVYTGTPAGVGPVQHGDQLSLMWGDDVLGEFTVSMSTHA